MSILLIMSKKRVHPYETCYIGYIPFSLSKNLRVLCVRKYSARASRQPIVIMSILCIMSKKSA